MLAIANWSSTRRSRTPSAFPVVPLQVPSAVITLKQGFGRLIRSLEDRGVLVLLDPRILRQRYGQTFLQSLPPYRMTTNVADVEKFFATIETNNP